MRTSTSRFSFPLFLALAAMILTIGPAYGQEETTREFDFSPGRTLSLDFKTGAGIRISGWDSSTVRVTYRLGGRDAADSRVEFHETETGLEIRTFQDGRSRSSSTSHEFEIFVPHDFNLRLDSMGGSLEMEDVEGEFRGKTMGGALTLRNVRGEARLTTMGGNVEVTDSELDGSLKTMGGEVLLKNVVGDVKGSSMGGDVRYENVRRSDGELSSPRGTAVGGLSADSVQISTMGGKIEVPDAPDGASVSTMGGDIHIEQAFRFVKAKTMGGDIRIDEVEGWVKATTMSGDIEVTVVGASDGEKGITLISNSGDVTLTVPADFSMELDLQIAYTRNSRRNFRIISDFPLRQEQDENWDYSKGTARRYIYGTGTLAGGKSLVRIETINGNIRLKKGSR